MKNKLISAVLLFIFLFSSSAALAGDYVDPLKWVPWYGYSLVKADSYGRYTIQDSYWGDYYSLSGFVYKSAYEHELIFNNYDGKVYVNGVNYWESDYPKPYLDTQLLDNPSEKNYTIGSLYPDIMKPQWYYGYMDFKNGNTSTDTAKVQVQRCYRIPSWSWSKWTVFLQQNVPLIPAWEQSIPSTKYWYYP